jgi:manganese-dependent inorganic pyrophosphatase
MKKNVNVKTGELIMEDITDELTDGVDTDGSNQLTTTVADNEKIYVVGHKNPDTDSVCSAIAYANLKSILTDEEYAPRRAGLINEETQFVLNRFGIETPPLLSDLRVQVKDVAIPRPPMIDGSVSIRTAWRKMKGLQLKTLPVARDKKLQGLITISDIANSYMDFFGNDILSAARTQYRNILTVINGKMVIGNKYSYLLRGKVVVLSCDEKNISQAIDPDDLVIIGEKEEYIKKAIDLNVGCIIVCQSNGISEEFNSNEELEEEGECDIPQEIIEEAEKKEIVIMTTNYDPYNVARLLNQSIPVRYFMTNENIISFKLNDYIDDIKPLMVQQRYSDFPVVDDEQRFLGFISRRCLINSGKKRVILVDHNEKSQAVDGIEQAEIIEIIDHHRIGNLETFSPVFFRNQPVGCTATIVYQMYQESLTKLTKEMAGLLCSAIISDTLMFRSPTCTTLDEYAARQLSEIAEIDIKDYAKEMFNAGSNIKNKSPEEIILNDFKQFTVNDIKFGVGQLNSMKEEEVDALTRKVAPALEKTRESQGLDYLFFMLTDILGESTYLICSGGGASAIVATAFDLKEEKDEVYLKGVVSRKKQLVPALVTTLQH